MKVRWRAWCFLVLLVLHSVDANPLTFRRSRRQTLSQQAGLEPLEQPVVYSEDLFGADMMDQGPRDKRKARILLNILFWKINTLLDLKTRLLAQISARQSANYFRKAPASSTPAPSSSEDEVPEFDSNRVMLDIPGELFGTAFSVVTDVSKVVGDVILNTARRTQKFVEGFKQTVARSLGYRITALTTSSSVSKSTGEEEENGENNSKADES